MGKQMTLQEELDGIANGTYKYVPDDYYKNYTVPNPVDRLNQDIHLSDINRPVRGQYGTYQPDISSSMHVQPKLREPIVQFAGSRNKSECKQDLKEYLEFLTKRIGEDCSAKYDYVYNTLPDVVDGKAFRVLVCYILAMKGIVADTSCWQSQW